MPDSHQPLKTVGLGFHFEDYEEGARFRTIGRTVTEADITAFVGATGMTESLFTDLEYLAEHSLLGGRPAPGALVYGFAEGLLMITMQQTGMAFMGMELRMEGPVLAGDTIHVEVEVTEARASSKPGRGVVTTRNEVVNQRGETVMVYTPTRLVKMRG